MKGGTKLTPASAIKPGNTENQRGESPDQTAEILLKAFQAPLSYASYALEAKEEHSFCHSRRVAELAELFADFLDLPSLDRQLLILTAEIHDIGKIGIPDAVLLKPGKLTEEEYAVMKRHAAIGADIIRRSSGMDMTGDRDTFAAPELFREAVAKMEEGIRHHHERWDGKGYPGGKRGKGIPSMSRIIALCDSADAMLSDRVYRKAMPMEQCREQIVINSGLMYDPEYTAVFLEHWDEIVTPVYSGRQ